jgi:tRNA dimethylallyltransferase
LVLLRQALVPNERAWLHERIAQRFHAMLAAGFVEEVRRLRERADLHAEAPSLRAVGYRQLWQHLDGTMDLAEATRLAIAATRQLAKRQLTWITADAGWQRLNPLDGQAREHWVDAMCSVCQSAK